EHAIAEADKRSSIANKLFCISTSINPAIDKITQGYQIADICNCDEVLDYAKSQSIDIAIIGPEAPLDAGLADALKTAAIGVVGPTKKLAQL
ncbi:phosphoribosylamine--glycine ligase N-terminal domain-containing protein, partial [Francisella tularensis]|uniref:phosphoribosylamine--glycine ligase N-terminal domain-containing protein n=1 Tax=Francisella tularensis TaxID=263 RepID=UPI002381985B